MQGYYDIVVNSGNDPVVGASVFVYNSTGALATIFQSDAPISEIVKTSDGTPYYLNQELVSPQSNPITTDSEGRYIFFAENGIYTVVITANGYNSKTLTVTLFDPTTQPNPVYSIAAGPPNDAVNVSVIGANVATTDGDFALVPKGAGALFAQVPDGTATGGNKRGQYAVDLQRIRIASANVASGLASTLVGGYSNQASASYASVVGGYVNQASGTYAVVGGGSGNVASNQSATVAGGLSNTASGLNSSIGGGTTNTASASESSVVGGSNNTANSVASTVVGGVYGTTRGIVGYVSVPACSIPIASKAGVSQAGLLNLGRQTTTSASVVLRSDANAAGAANQLILANNSAIHFNATVVAYVTGGGNSKSWAFTGLIKRGANAASTTLVGSGGGSLYADAGAFVWDAVLSADTTNGGLAVTVTGETATTIRWVCKIETTEVAY